MSDTPINERTTDEAVLRQAAQKLQAVLDSIADGLAVLDNDWRYTYMNEPGARILGMRPQDFLGRVVWELFPRAEGTKFHEEYHRAVASGQPVQFEEFYPEPLNLWLECRCFPSPEGLSVYFHDITTRKKAEALLRQNERLFATLIDQAPTGVYVVDAQFRLLQINALALPAFAKIEPKLGRDFAEVLNLLWGTEVGGQLTAIFRHTLATGEPYKAPLFSEYRQDLAVEKSYEWQTQRVTLPDGQHGVVCYFNDLTDRIQNERTLLQAKTAAESASRSKDQFLAALSHELRTPLNPALLIASESADNDELPETVRENFEIIRKNIELEARLIDDLLDLTRITTGKMILNRSFVDVHDTLADALTTIQAELQEKAIVLFVNLRAKFSQVEGDAVRLQQVFWNVLKNAVKFTPREGQITVETTVNQANQLITKITDTGIGMNAEELGRAFSAFAQGDHAGDMRAHRFGGLGLGLAISQNLASLHEGKISAQSGGNNQGSVFTIELPLARRTKNKEDRAEASSRPSPRATSPGVAPWRILLVEDHETTRIVLSQLLVRRNYTVVTADCLSNARALARQEKFDLLISDIGLPDGNGNDLMKEFRENYGLRGIALTGYGMDEDVVRGKAAGFITHLIKPVGIESLEHALAQVRHAV